MTKQHGKFPSKAEYRFAAKGKNTPRGHFLFDDSESETENYELTKADRRQIEDSANGDNWEELVQQGKRKNSTDLWYQSNSQILRGN